MDSTVLGAPPPEATDDDGRFELRVVSHAAAVTVLSTVADRERDLVGATSTEVSGRGVRWIEIPLRDEKGTRVLGRVTRAGRPVASAQVSFEAIAGTVHGADRSARTDDAGRFDVTRLLDERHRVRVGVPGRASFDLGVVPTPPGEPLELALPDGPVARLSISAGGPGAGPESLVVHVVPMADGAGSIPLTADAFRPLADGRGAGWPVEDLAPMTFRLDVEDDGTTRVAAPGRAPGAGEVVLAPGPYWIGIAGTRRVTRGRSSHLEALAPVETGIVRVEEGPLALHVDLGPTVTWDVHFADPGDLELALLDAAGRPFPIVDDRDRVRRTLRPGWLGRLHATGVPAAATTIAVGTRDELLAGAQRVTAPIDPDSPRAAEAIIRAFEEAKAR